MNLQQAALHIIRSKFRRLSTRRQHEYLAALVTAAQSGLKYDHFQERYSELQSWVNLDQYVPPAWLTTAEALEEYLFFHTRFSAVPAQFFKKETELTLLSWHAGFDCEIVIDQVRSPFNVGSILRLIDNFGLRRLVHSTSWLRLQHPQLRKAARGCEHWIPVAYEPDLPAYLTQTEVPVIGIENDSEAILLDKWEPPSACIFVLGNESYGIAAAIRKLCTQKVSIPMFGFKKSMNVHHALAIVCQKYVTQSGFGKDSLPKSTKIRSEGDPKN